MNGFFDSVIFAVIILLVGFVFLVKGADFFVEGSSGIAKKFKVPAVIIGLTVVAMGTSLPEAAVSITASISGNNSLAISNAVGSNIFNMMAVIGCCAVISPIMVSSETRKRDIPFSIVCALLLLVFGYLGMVLGRLDGLMFFAIFIIYIVYLVWLAMKNRKTTEGQEVAPAAEEAPKDEEGQQPQEKIAIWKCLLFIVVGAAGIVLGGNWVVDGASTIATAAGMSQTLVGLTIVSIGTSLPELVTSIVAARKKQVDMALGNAIGSNIFNIMMVSGLAAAISPIGFIMENIFDIIVLIIFSIIVWVFAKTKNKITRWEGVLMLLLYVEYVIYICIR